MTERERRMAAIAEIVDETGIDEAMIERLVRAFYAKVQDDALLGPVFNERIADWEAHLQKMFAFWSSVTLMSGRYHGQPMIKHLPLPVDSRHFDRWLMLFEETAREICPPPAAKRFMQAALRIAMSLELGVAGHVGAHLAPSERLKRPDEEVFLPETQEAAEGYASPPCSRHEIDPAYLDPTGAEAERGE